MFGLLAVTIVATYAASFAGVEFAVAARTDADEIVARALTRSVVVAPGIPALTGPAVQSLAALAKDVSDPVLIRSSKGLIEKFSEVGYWLSAVQQGDAEVPRLYLTSLPRDLPELTSVKARKELYISLLLPLVLRANESILEDRRRAGGHIARLREGKRLGTTDAAWLTDLMQKHGIEEGKYDELMTRVDVVPPSLAIAQSIEESGWGTSRFALQGNAVFGQWTFSVGKGIVPANRDSGATHEVRRFDHLQQSVRMYIENLNRHRAYREFRAERAEMRERGEPLSGLALTRTLTRYSQRGQEYVETLYTIMRSNALDSLDSAKLEN